MNYYLKISNFENMSFFEFMWKYERLCAQLKKEKENNLQEIPLQNLI